MVVAVVQTNQNERTGPAVTSLSVTLTGVTAGNRIIVFVFYDCNAAPIGSCSDGTNTYAMLASTGLLSSAYAVEAFITQNVVASGGNFTITADSNSASNYPGFIVASEVSGASEWHDGFAGTVNTTTTPTSGLGPGSTQANGMSFALCVAQTSSTNIGYDVSAPTVSLYTQQNGSITGRACAFYSRPYSAVGTQGIGFGTLASSSPCPRLLVFIPEPAPRWGFISISAPNVVASGNAVLAMPPAGSGVLLPGDLLVAGVCCRGNAAFTAPSGWTIHEALNTGNTSTTLATATAGGFLASFNYDGSAGPYTFSRSGGDVALGRIAAYRAVDVGAWAYDASHATVNSVAQRQVDDPGFTTTASGDLIVGVAATSRATSVLSLQGLGIANSATTSLVTQPGATAATPRWVRRADSSTTTGADCGLAMGEGIMSGVGATGTLTMDTSSSNSLHAYLAAGFKLVTSTTYNDTITGSEAAGDTSDAIGTFVPTLTDAGAASDAATGGSVYVDTLTGQITGGEVVAVLGTFVATTTDARASADTIIGVGVYTYTADDDSAEAADVTSGGSIFTSGVTDGGTATEATTVGRIITKTTIPNGARARDNIPRITGTRIRYVSNTDTSNADVGTSLSVQLTARPTMTQTAVAGDAVSAGAETTSASISDSRAVSDAATVALVFALPISDACASGAVLTVQATDNASIEDDSATADDLGLDGQSIYRTVMSDVAPSMDSSAVAVLGVPATVDDATALDALGLIVVFHRTATDAAEAVDAADNDYTAPGSILSDATASDGADVEVIAEAEALDFAIAQGYFDDHATRRRRVVWVS